MVRDVNRLAVEGRTLTNDALKELLLDGVVQDADDGSAVDDQTDADDKLWNPQRELSRTVQGIDDRNVGLLETLQGCLRSLRSTSRTLGTLPEGVSRGSCLRPSRRR